jgi:hypothetical protein
MPRLRLSESLAVALSGFCYGHPSQDNREASHFDELVLTRAFSGMKVG